MVVLVGGHLQGCLLLTELPWNLPAVPSVFTGPSSTYHGTSPPSSSIDEVKVESLILLKSEETFSHLNLLLIFDNLKPGGAFIKS